jgi:hypothetical protein
LKSEIYVEHSKAITSEKETQDAKGKVLLCPFLGVFLRTMESSMVAQEAETGRIVGQGQPGQKVSETPPPNSMKRLSVVVHAYKSQLLRRQK